VIGTSSLRRQAFLLRRRPDLKIKPLRGNVPTRIEKMRAGQVDCAVLARAGLERLGMFDPSFLVLGPDVMLPAAAQGIVGIEIRDGDERTAALFDAVHHTETGYVAAAERAALATLDGSCHTPIGAYAVLKGGQLHLKVAVASADGSAYYEDEQTGPVASDAEARHLGQLVGLRLKSRVPADLFL
jgi:hydroxymethylbilane synthase